MSTNTEQPNSEQVPLETIVRHPIQPLVEEDGVVRFKRNKIVGYLLDKGGIDLNDIARQDFSIEDREQFAQLIGYSHAGAHDLWYMTPTVLEVAETMYIAGKSDKDERDRIIANLENKLETLRIELADTLCNLFEVHPDDMKGA